MCDGEGVGVSECVCLVGRRMGLVDGRLLVIGR